ncbi:MAG: polysaccharide deacetylase family protein, partial [Niabella sp.]
LKKRGWGVTMTHGITYGYDHFKSADILWEHLNKVKALEDQVWVGTFREVAAYEKEREALRYEVVKKKNGFIVRTQLLLDKVLFTEPLTGVIDQKNIKSIKITQGEKKLKPRIVTGKVLFDFDPYGKEIDITIK